MTDLSSDPDGLGIVGPDPADVAAANDAVADEEPDDLLDRLRHTGVGVEDPNIVGNAGPTDVAPGRDPGGDGLLVVVDEGQILEENVDGLPGPTG